MLLSSSCRGLSDTYVMSKFESEVFGGKAMLFLAFPACLFDDEMFSRRSNTHGGRSREAEIPSFLALVFGTRYAYLVAALWRSSATTSIGDRLLCLPMRRARSDVQ